MPCNTTSHEKRMRGRGSTPAALATARAARVGGGSVPGRSAGNGVGLTNGGAAPPFARLKGRRLSCTNPGHATGTVPAS